MTEDLLKILESTRFRPNYYRRIASNNCSCLTMTFGITGLASRSWPSKKNEQFPELYKALIDFGHSLNPDFTYTSITVNKNFQSFPHYDRNEGLSMITALGSFTGGNLNIEGQSYNIRNKVRYFDGSFQEHWTEPFEGTRYSIIYFTRA